MVPNRVDEKVKLGVESLVGEVTAVTVLITGAVLSVSFYRVELSVDWRVMFNLRLLVFVPTEKGCDFP
jgi:hypothetical protein